MTELTQPDNAQEPKKVRVTMLLSQQAKTNLHALAKQFGCPQYAIVDALACAITPNDPRFEEMVLEKIDEMPFAIQRWKLMQSLQNDPQFASFIRNGQRRRTAVQKEDNDQ
jgi:hypothetical protein